MPRVALVTGGTLGVGAAIAKALKAAGYTVAAVYHGNDEAAQKFKAATGIAVYQNGTSLVEGVRRRHQAGRGRARSHRHPGQQCRHHPRRGAAPHDRGAVERGDPRQPRCC